MNDIITNGFDDKCLGDVLVKFGSDTTKVIMVTAFFSDADTVKSLLAAGNDVTLVVSLRPPTNPYEIRKIMGIDNLTILYHDDLLHSKIYAFYDDNRVPEVVVIGSSNLTSRGLRTSIETNVILDDAKVNAEAKDQISWIVDSATPLDPDILDDYTVKFDEFRKSNLPNIDGDQDDSGKQSKTMPISRKALRAYKPTGYNKYWGKVNAIRDLIMDLVIKEYPAIPVYLVTDNFWHYIAVSKDPLLKKLIPSGRDTNKVIIRKLFSNFLKDEESKRWITKTLYKKAKETSGILSYAGLGKINVRDCKFIYDALHSTENRTRRGIYNSDQFVKENSLGKIAKSIYHLVHGRDPIEVRISDLINDPKWKLTGLGQSSISELLGWSDPKKYPIRNAKADNAVKTLGF